MESDSGKINLSPPGLNLTSAANERISLKLPEPLVTGIFRTRPNRFLALIDLAEEKSVPCFVPNPGRLSKLLVPGVEVVLSKIPSNPKRKTQYDVVGVHHGSQIVSIDSRIPNKLIYTALQRAELDEFIGYDLVKSEYKYRKSRLDFLLSAKNREDCLLEIKSCTLVQGEWALFPDAPTERGRRHMMDLIVAKKEGFRACALFLVQRIDVTIFSPNDELDPKFGEALRKAAIAGVEVYSYSSTFRNNELSIARKLLVDLRW